MDLRDVIISSRCALNGSAPIGPGLLLLLLRVIVLPLIQLTTRLWCYCVDHMLSEKSAVDSGVYRSTITNSQW